MNFKKTASLLIRIIGAIILLQTLYFKITAHPESVVLFSKLGVEPWGRIVTACIELITALMLLIPATAFVGAFMGVGLMLGAIVSHLAILGIQSNGDGGELFFLAFVVLFCCLIILRLENKRGAAFYQKIFNKGPK